MPTMSYLTQPVEQSTTLYSDLDLHLHSQMIPRVNLNKNKPVEAFSTTFRNSSKMPLGVVEQRQGRQVQEELDLMRMVCSATSLKKCK